MHSSSYIRQDDFYDSDRYWDRQRDSSTRVLRNVSFIQSNEGNALFSNLSVLNYKDGTSNVFIDALPDFYDTLRQTILPICKNAEFLDANLIHIPFNSIDD
ncbi:MAG TPA: hypothetical protein VHM20_08400, partial [Gammaproteobacteria bacterium]|nr:hypothetical protein [Gammaproteobacteria bacterium]